MANFLTLTQTMKTLLINLFCLFCFANCFAQISGNQTYRQNDYENNKGSQNFFSTDSTLNITVKVLLNQNADKFVLTIGVNQEGKTTKDCMTKINERIENLRLKLLTIGIKNENIYVDFISQTKIYDFTMKSNQAEQFEKGFETKKNIIISTQNLNDIEKIITEAAEFEIFDVIKVDYSNDNIESIYNQLFDEAFSLIERKKNKYFTLFKPKIIGEPRANDHFYVTFPKDSYKEYTAYETAEVSKYSSNYTKKTAKKSSTFYYEGMDYSGFDKVINQAQTEVGIQYMLTLSLTYTLQKTK